MSELKTKPTNQPPKEFLESITPERKREDSFRLLELFEEITKEKPVMWGSSIIGFGKYHYKSERSTQEGDWPLIAFSPRKQNLTLYIMFGNNERKDLLDKLGKYKSSVSCLYINKLSDIDLDILKRMIRNSYEYMKERYNI